MNMNYTVPFIDKKLCNIIKKIIFALIDKNILCFQNKHWVRLKYNIQNLLRKPPPKNFFLALVKVSRNFFNYFSISNDKPSLCC